MLGISANAIVAPLGQALQNKLPCHARFGSMWFRVCKQTMSNSTMLVYNVTISTCGIAIGNITHTAYKCSTHCK